MLWKNLLDPIKFTSKLSLVGKVGTEGCEVVELAWLLLVSAAKLVIRGT